MRIFHIRAGAHPRKRRPGKPCPHKDWNSRAMCGSPVDARSSRQSRCACRPLCKPSAALQLVDLHISDLINKQLPSHYDYTSQYDLLVFRRLAASSTANRAAPVTGAPAGRLSGPPILRRIDTSPVGFAVFDRVLLTVHPDDCTVRDTYADKLTANRQAPGSRAGGCTLAHQPCRPDAAHRELHGGRLASPCGAN